MGYVGNPLPANFQASPAVVRFGDGSDTTFALGRTISNVQDILVSVDGVVQDSLLTLFLMGLLLLLVQLLPVGQTISLYIFGV